MSVEIPPETRQDFWDAEVNEHNKRQALWTMALARAYDLPGPAQNSGITRVTNHYYGQAAQGGAAAPVKGFLSSPLAKGLLMGLGGPALVAAGAFLPGLLSPKPELPPMPAPIQRVDIGTIGPDGKIVQPPKP